MPKTKLVLGCVAASVFVAAPALAADPFPSTAGLGIAAKGNLIISADRMFGFNSWRVKATTDPLPTDPPPQTKRIDTESFNQFGLLWAASPEGALGFNPYTVPRISVDFTVIESLSIGGSIGFATASSKNSTDYDPQVPPARVKVERDGPTYGLFVFAPRAGYIIPVSPSMSFWARGGFTYFSASSSQDTFDASGLVTGKRKTSISGFALNLEPTFTISPIEHFGFYFGGVVDIPLSGTATSERTTGATTVKQDTSVTFLNFGIVSGLLGWL